MGTDGATFGDTGVPTAVISGIRNFNRRVGRIPVRGMRADLTVEFRANRVGFNANLMLAFLSIRLPVASMFRKRGNRSRRQGDDRAVLPHGFLTGIPSSHRPDLLHREGGEKQVRIPRLPGCRLGFIQGQADQPLRRGKSAAVFREDRFFDPGNLRPDLPAGRPAFIPEQTPTALISICACQFHLSSLLSHFM
jgi:hypothetical protein